MSKRVLRGGTTHYLNNNAGVAINFNGIHLIHDKNDGFKIVKVKLGYNNIYEDIEISSEIRNFFSFCIPSVI